VLLAVRVGGCPGPRGPGRKGERTVEEAAISERDPQIPDSVEGEPVVGVEPATQPLTPEEVRQAQKREGGEGEPEDSA
jgi:hypothetical protein